MSAWMWNLLPRELNYRQQTHDLSQQCMDSECLTRNGNISTLLKVQNLNRIVAKEMVTTHRGHGEWFSTLRHLPAHWHHVQKLQSHHSKSKASLTITMYPTAKLHSKRLANTRSTQNWSGTATKHSRNWPNITGYNW
jgi:hypothetical protein